MREKIYAIRARNRSSEFGQTSVGLSETVENRLSVKRGTPEKMDEKFGD
jgi:hypothetical protein